MRRLTLLVIALSLALGAFGCGDGENGAMGEPGEQGPAGPAGQDGEDGEGGEDGRDGADGADGEDGQDGAQGPQGEQGPRGPVGTEGRHDLSDYVTEGGEGRTIVANGGEGTDGDGGDARWIEMFNYNGNSDIRMLRSGTPNTAFEAPSYPPYLGDNPKTISSNTTFNLGGSLMPNTVVAGNMEILGDDGTNPATGLHVEAEATLTIEVNWDRDNADADNTAGTGTLEQAHLYFAEGILLEGRIVVSRRDQAAQGDTASLHTGDLWLEASQFVSRAGSSIDTSGDDNDAGNDGGNAGDIELETHGIQAGTIILAADVDATGGDGDNGGHGGNVDLSGNGYGTLYVLGSIDSSGGTGNDGLGGDAGSHSLNADSDYSGGNYISGESVRARGGDGTDGGGDGGYIEIETDSNGAVVITPEVTIDSSAGHATDDGTGGTAGGIDIYAYGGTMRVAGTLLARGGNGDGTGDGGNGNYITFETSYSDYPYNNDSGGYGMYIGANVDASGGDGANGGDAGYVSLFNFGAYDSGEAQLGVDPLLMLGYESFEASGGDGTVNGGTVTGTCYVDTYDSAYDGNGDYWSAGSIVNEVSWTSNGGNGGSGSGGGAGSIEFNTEYDYSYPETPNLTNTAALTAVGGDGNSGGGGGYIELYAYGTMTNTGALDASGGDGMTTGGEGGNIELAGDYELVNEADLTTRGGDGSSGDGGDGGWQWMAGRFMTHEGAIDASGGWSVSGSGGDGEIVEIISTERPSTLSGSVASAGGNSTNGTDGEHGQLFIDALQVDLGSDGSIEL